MRNLQPALGLIGIGWYFAICIIAGVVGGLWLDGQADTKPLFTLLGIGLGLATAGYGGHRMLMGVLRPPRRPQ